MWGVKAYWREELHKDADFTGHVLGKVVRVEGKNLSDRS